MKRITLLKGNFSAQRKKKELLKDKEYHCLVCSGEYGQPPLDNWIQCGDGKDQDHEGFTDYVAQVPISVICVVNNKIKT